MSQRHLHTELISIVCEIQSEKINCRVKALNRLDELFNRRLDELKHICNDNSDAEVNWTQFFECAFTGLLRQIDRITSHAGKASENKNVLHSLIIQKIVRYANEDEFNIPPNIILQKCFRILEHDFERSHFGMCFLQIIEKNILVQDTDLTAIKCNHWTRILSVLYAIYFGDEKFRILSVAQCIYNTSRLGLQYSYVIEIFDSFLKQIEEALLDLDKGSLLNEWIKIGFLYCKNICLNDHVVVQNFIQSIFPQLIKSYEPHLPDEIRNIIFDFGCLTIVLKTEINDSQFFKMVKQFYIIVEQELKFMNGQSLKFTRNPDVSEIFIKFASNVCFVLFWYDLNTPSSLEDECAQSSAKRTKRSNKLQAFLDLFMFDGVEFNWRWITIFSRFLSEYSNIIPSHELKLILEMVTKYQSIIQYPIQIESMLNCCRFLINQECEIKKRHSKTELAILNDLCGLWEKLTLAVYRATTTNTDHLLEYHDLLAILIQNKKFISPTFIKTALSDFSTKIFPKNSKTLKTLSAILEIMDIDLIENSNKLIEECLSWLYHKIDIVKESLKTKKDDIQEEINKITVMFCIAGKGRLSLQANTSTLDSKFDWCKQLEKIISLKTLNEIIIQDLNVLTNEHHAMELGTSNRSVINEHILEYVIILLKFNQDFSSNERCSDITYLLTHIEMLLDMINYMVMYGAVNKETFDKMYFLKKLNMLLQLIEKFFEDDPTIKFDSKKMIKILNILNNIFSSKYHVKIGTMLRNYTFINLFKYIIKQLGHTLDDSKKIKLIAEDTELQNVHSIIRYKSFHLLAIYSHFNGNHTEQIFEFLEIMKFNLASNIDIYIVFSLIEITCQTEPLESKAHWVIDNMRELCTKYHGDQAISEKIIDLLPYLIKFCAQFSSLTDDIFTIVYVFIKKCSQKIYSYRLAEKIIKLVKYLIKSYKDLLDSSKFQQIIRLFVSFMESSILTLQLQTVECLVYVFNQNWLLQNDLDTDLTTFYRFLFNIMPYNIESIEEPSENAISVKIQLLIGIISVNYYLRKESLFQVLEEFYKRNTNSLKIKHILTLSCKLFDIKVNELIENNFEYLLSKWLTKNYLMGKFPWYLTECESQSNFFIHFKEIISFGVLRYKCDLLEDFAKIISIDIRDLITPILPSCIALLVPYYSNCLTLSENYKINSITLERKLMEFFTMDEIDLVYKDSMIEIIQNLLLNYNDESVFQTLFHFDITFVQEEFSIDKPTFHHCLQYLQAKMIKNDQLNIILNYCAKRPVEILHLLNFIKLKLQNSTIIEDKLLYFLHYCVLMEYVEIYLKTKIIVENKENDQDQLISIKEMFVRDFIYFISNLVLSENQKYIQINIASIRYLKKFLSSVLLNQNCLIYFKNIFSYIITTLTTAMKFNRNSIVMETSNETLKMVILNNYDLLKELIEQIDKFPSEANFNELNTIIKRKRVIISNNNLAAEVSTFIKNQNIKLESLTRLKDKLELKQELRDFYKILQNNCDYSEDCENSVIHQLIFKLFKIVQGNDLAKSIESAKCLGELGISDLTTILLKSNPQSNFHEIVITYEEAVDNFIYATFEKLNLYLSHPDVRVIKCALDTCEYLSFTKSAQNVINHFLYLNVFIYRINKLQITKEIFMNRNICMLKIDDFFKYDEDSHTLWIKELSFTLIKLLDNSHLANICKLQLSYCERILPILVQVLLFVRNKNYSTVVQNFLALFFKRHEKCLAENEENQDIVYLSKKSLRIILNMVEVIRLYNQVMCDDKDRIEINYLDCAKGALYCKSYFTAILYCELHALHIGEANDDLKTVMQKAYTLIGDSDSASVFVDPIKSRLEYLSLKNSLHNINLNYDALLHPSQLAETSNQKILFKSSLLNSGFYYLTRLVPQQSEIDYEAHWRMADWNISTSDHSSESNGINFEEHHYRALKCLYNRDELEMFKSVDSARMSIINSIKLSSLECTKHLYDSLLKLQMLQQVCDFSKFQFKERSEENCKTIIDKWNIQDLIPASDFQLREKILSQRYSIFSTLGIRGMRALVKFKPEPIQNILLNIVQESRANGNINVAIRNLAKLSAMEKTISIKGQLIIEDSQLQWMTGDKNLAKLLLKNLLSESDFNVSLNKIVALRLFGEYLTESESENPIVIYRDYFNASLKLLEKFTNKKDDFLKIQRDITEEYFNLFENTNKIDIYDAIANYADKVYVQKTTYMKSPEYLSKKECNEKNKQTIKDLMPKVERNQVNTDERKLLHMLKKNILIDVSEMRNTEKEKGDYLILSLSYYIKSAIISPILNDLSIFRITSLWLSNKNNDNVAKLISNDLLKIPSHKFLIAISQISAHLTDTSDRCGALIYKLLEKCATDHPHHTLSYIFAMANSYADSPGVAPSTDSRVQTSKQLLKKLKENTKINMIINQMELMNSSLIKLANENLDIVGNSAGNYLKKLKLLDAVQCPTINLNIIQDCKYDELTSIVSWDPNIEKVSGINMPKKIVCLCSDGKLKTQLLKGKDDLRQDAVMQQVFTILNQILASNKETSRRKLHIRTYKIVPLSQRSGILQWCENTIPIGTYLVGFCRKDYGAHKKYRPKDMSATECRELMTKFREKSNEEKLENYQRICEKIKPVFHHFFLELYQCPAVWFKRRLGYVNSVATNSMIGYILGLGDRHVQNILIDKKTAEVIHIDFGIAFEQGKILPTPETIPFRLSRDIVSPMGVCGVNGQFRSSSEKVMDIMRIHKLTIITILEVLLYDPLYSWKLTNKKAYSKQAAIEDEGDETDSNTFENDNVITNDETNTTAERALMRLQEKLRGEEIGATGMSSVEAQVDRLIQQATDPNNLSRLFPGWQPYL